MILIIAIILIVITILTLILLFYFMYRNHKVCNFRLYILKLCSDKAQKDIINWRYYHQPYDNLPSYDTMLYSFKPLKLKYWVSKEHNELLVLWNQSNYNYIEIEKEYMYISELLK